MAIGMNIKRNKPFCTVVPYSCDRYHNGRKCNIAKNMHIFLWSLSLLTIILKSLTIILKSTMLAKS